MTVTDQDLQQWHALSEDATPGPWKTCEAQPEAACVCGLVWSIPADSPVAAWHNCDGHDGRAQDVLFIAAARTAVPKLIVEVKKLRAIVDPDAEHAHLVLLRDATVAAIADVGPKMDASYGELIAQLAGEKERLLTKVEWLRPIYEMARAYRTAPTAREANACLAEMGRLVDTVLATKRDEEG